MTKSKAAVAALFAAAVLAGFGCTDDDEGQPFFALDGEIYTQTFSCNQTLTGQPTTCPDFNVPGQIQFARTGSNVFEARNIPDTGILIVGSFSGFDLHWTATHPNGDAESGTWAFSSNGSVFAGASHYAAGDGSYAGDCRTNGDRDLGAAPDPPAPAGCP